MTRKTLHIAVLHGGPSSEHDISVWSSGGVIAALRASGHRLTPVYVDKTGRWHVGVAQAGEMLEHSATILEGAQQLVALQPDLCFLGFHGTYGEDGRIQALLDLAGLPYTGSGVLASAAAMDKPLARRIFAGVGIPVAAAVEVQSADLRHGDVRAVATRLATELGLPVVVKVPAGGSSVGVEIPRDFEALVQSLSRLAADAELLLCEQYIAGVELTAGVLQAADGSLQALPIVEIAPKTGEFFDFTAKYQAGGSDEIVPARISAESTLQVQELGLRAHRALGCAGVSRTDVILRADGHPFVLETNTLPGLTPASLLPKAAAAAGLDYSALLARIIACAVKS